MHYEVNWIAIIIATIASNALGMAWYMGLSKQWQAATERTMAQMSRPGRAGAIPFVWGAICQLVMAYFIAMLTPQLFEGTTIYGAVLVGMHMWFGFTLTGMVLNHRYQNLSWRLTLIDGGYLLGVVIVQGVVIGLFG